ncbi:MAG: sulfonate transport system substrate-binding protein [Limisphaerales bacterium]|jgi:sulfonate transport system substrate-binding protein
MLENKMDNPLSKTSERKPHHFIVGGVPEHFNLPWHLARESGGFSEAGIRVDWQDFHGGTGALNKALREGEIDIAVVLTEGIIADMHRGNPSSIVQIYIQSPLIWGIHVGEESKFMEPDDLQGGTYSISRYGSGSHLISFVDAMQRGWDIGAQKFKVVGNLEGALEALTKGNADCLLWEKFTTKPYVDSGIVRRIGEVHTPWPCFVMAVRNDRLQEDKIQVSQLCKVIQAYSKDFMSNENAKAMVAERYKLLPEDVEQWYNATRWAVSNEIPNKAIDQTINTLFELGLIDYKMKPEELIASPGILC